MDTKNIFTPDLQEIRFHTTLQFPLPNYIKKDWRVRMDFKYHFNGDEDFDNLCMYSSYQHGGLTESIKHYPSPIHYREITYHFECFDTDFGISEKGKIGGHLIKLFKELIKEGRFQEYDDSYYIEYVYTEKKLHELPYIETEGEKYNFDNSHTEALKKNLMPKDLKHSLADS